MRRVVVFVLVFFFLPLQSFAASVAVVGGPFSSWYSPQTLATYKFYGIDAPVTGSGIVTRDIGTSTPYTAQVNSGGVATLQTTLPLSVSPPPGAVPSSAQTSSALALAGAGGIAAGTLVADVPLGSGVGSLAANLAMPALGFTLAGAYAAPVVIACVAGACPVLAALAAAGGVVYAGSALWAAMQANGLSLNSDGSLAQNLTSGGMYSSGSSYSASSLQSLSDLIANDWHSYGSNYSSVSCGVYSSTDIQCIVNSGHYDYPVAYSSSTRPATSADVTSAVIASVASPSVAKDAADLAIKNGVDIQAAINLSSVAATIAAIHLESQFSQLSSSIDSLGNTQSLLQRTVADIPACSSAPCLPPQVSVQSVPVVNGSAQSVNTVSQAPAIAAAVGAAVGAATAVAAQTQTDLCAVHPDALACSNDAGLGDVPLQPLPTHDLSVLLTPVNVPGLAVCPAPIIVGLGKVFDFSGICIWLGMLKPLILAFAWLSAGAMVFRGRPYA